MEKDNNNKFKGIYSKKINLYIGNKKIKKEEQQNESFKDTYSNYSSNTLKTNNNEKDNIPTFIIDFNKNEKKYKPLSRQRNNSFNNLRKTTDEEIPISFNLPSKDDSQNLSILNNTTISGLKTNFTIRRKVDESFRCCQCPLIPFITFELISNNNNNEILVIEKCENGHINKLSLKDFIESNKKINLNEVKCCKCNNIQKNQKIPFSYCKICNLFFCNDCRSIHSWQHNLIISNELDSLCYNHVEKFIYYCDKCNRNLCTKCYREHKKSFQEHNIVLLGKMCLNEKEITELQNKLIKEESNILNENKHFESKIEELNYLMVVLKNNFQNYKDLMENKIKVFKKLLNIYNNGRRQQNLNYEIIQNVRTSLKNNLNFEFNFDNFLSIKRNFLNLNISNQYSFIIKGIYGMEEKKIEGNDFSLSLYNEIENMKQSVLSSEIGVNTDNVIDNIIKKFKKNINNEVNESENSYKKFRSKSLNDNLEYMNDIKENIFDEKKGNKYEINNFGSINFFSNKKMDNNFVIQNILNESFTFKFKNKIEYLIENNHILIEGKKNINKEDKSNIFEEEKFFYQIKGNKNIIFEKLEKNNLYFELLSYDNKKLNKYYQNYISNPESFNILKIEKNKNNEIINNQHFTINKYLNKNSINNNIFTIEINNQLSLFGNKIKNKFNILSIEEKVNNIDILKIKNNVLSIDIINNFGILTRKKVNNLSIDINNNFEILNKKKINNLSIDMNINNFEILNKIKIKILSIISVINNLEFLPEKKEKTLRINNEIKNEKKFDILLIKSNINNLEIINRKKLINLSINSNLNNIQILKTKISNETNLDNTEFLSKKKFSILSIDLNKINIGFLKEEKVIKTNVKIFKNLSINSNLNIIEFLFKKKEQISYFKDNIIEFEIIPNKISRLNNKFSIESFNIQLKSKFKNFSLIDFSLKDKMEINENIRYSNTSNYEEKKLQILNYSITKETNVSFDPEKKTQKLIQNINNMSNRFEKKEQIEKPISSLSFRERLQKFDNQNKKEDNQNYLSSNNPKDKISTLQRYQMINEHSGIINCLIELSKGDFISCSDDKTIKIFDSSHYYQNKLSISPHLESITYLSKISNNYILSSSFDKSIKLIQLSENSSYSIIKQTISLHNGKINKLILLKNNKIVSCGSDSLILIFDFNQNENNINLNKKIICKSIGIDNIIESIKNNYLYAFSEQSNSIEIYNLDNFELINIIDNINYIGGNKGVVLYKNEYFIFCIINGLSILNLNSNQIEKKIENNYSFNSISLIRDDFLFGGGIETLENKKKIIIKIWKIKTKDKDIILEDFDIKYSPHSKPINCFLELSNKKIITGSNDSSIKIWNYNPDIKSN